MSFTDEFINLFSENFLSRLHEVRNFENHVPGEIQFLVLDSNADLVTEIIRLASLSVFPRRIRRSGILLDVDRDGNTLCVRIRFAAKKNQRRLISDVCDRDLDVKKPDSPIDSINRKFRERR